MSTAWIEEVESYTKERKKKSAWSFCAVNLYVCWKYCAHFASANVKKGKQMGANHFQYTEKSCFFTEFVPNGQINLMNQYLSKNCNHLFTLTWIEYYRVLSVDMTHSKYNIKNQLASNGRKWSESKHESIHNWERETALPAQDYSSIVTVSTRIAYK